MVGSGSSGSTLPPERDLPLHQSWTDEDSYVQSLLDFVTKSDLFRSLCGGVHILDFLTREPDLYSTVLPLEWRDWFEQVDIHDVLQLLLRENLEEMVSREHASWENGPTPPPSLVKYALTVRRHCLTRDYLPLLLEAQSSAIPRRLKVGMKPKKLHEVQNFSAYVSRLSSYVAEETGEPVAGFVDFGSGQNYLGRTLASPPFDQNVIAIERKHHNVAGAKDMDIYAKVAKKQKIKRNKKEYKRQLRERADTGGSVSSAANVDMMRPDLELVASKDDDDVVAKGSVSYIQHDIKDGSVEDVIYRPTSTTTTSASSSDSEDPTDESRMSENTQNPTSRPKLMVMSIHSCGNLSHHGLRTLTTSLNPSVSAVALIGCCYNLLTERLGPATYKHPQLRPQHPRLEATGSAYDPHGFPMSKTLEGFLNPDGSKGVRLNITARMMAVQAPYNWGREDSEAFFTRHFYRALLQRILMDLGVVKQSSKPETESIVGGSISGRDDQGTPLVIGSLRKAAFSSFSAYVHAAMQKLAQDHEIGGLVESQTSSLTDDLIMCYENRFAYTRKQLAIMWSLMAFSAGVVESVIVVDRWLWLKEQEGWVGRCWVEPVFDYKWSPRNLVVVGIRKRQRDHSEGTNDLQPDEKVVQEHGKKD
jgi:Methyltransferase domain